jgi:hypothetical protein
MCIYYMNEVPTGACEKTEKHPFFSIAIAHNPSPCAHCVVTQDYFLSW